jgi:hypothetical protein
MKKSVVVLIFGLGLILFGANQGPVNTDENGVAGSAKEDK